MKIDGLYTYMNSGFMLEPTLQCTQEFTLVFQFRYSQCFTRRTENKEYMYPVFCIATETGSYPLFIYIKGGNICFHFTNRDTAVPFDFDTEKWHTMVICHSASQGSTPWIVIFYDGISMLCGGVERYYTSGDYTLWLSSPWGSGTMCFGSGSTEDENVQFMNGAFRNVFMVDYSSSVNIVEGRNFGIYYATEYLFSPFDYSLSLNDLVRNKINSHRVIHNVMRYQNN